MTDVSAGFRPPCWCPSRWAPAWRLHTNLYKFGENVSPHISRKKNCCDLNLGESLCISTFFLFSDFRLNLLNGFDFLFYLFWMAWHWKPAIDSHIVTKPVFVAKLTTVSVLHEILERVADADADAVWACHAMLPRNAWQAQRECACEAVGLQGRMEMFWGGTMWYQTTGALNSQGIDQDIMIYICLSSVT